MLRRLLGPPLKLDFEVALLTVYTTLALMVDYYWTFTPNKYVDRVILYLLIPLLLIVLVLRKHPAQYGMTFGDWKAGLVITTLAIGAMTIILWLLVHNDASMQKYYAPLWSGRFLAESFIEMAGWEFIFRGFLLFGYARRFGHDALWMQSVPFALAHISKPPVETLSTIFGGFAFGWVAWRTRSYLYPMLIHWYMVVAVVLLSASMKG
jgi:membrane protease YdiL (CAAX protease family)